MHLKRLKRLLGYHPKDAEDEEFRSGVEAVHRELFAKPMSVFNAHHRNNIIGEGDLVILYMVKIY